MFSCTSHIIPSDAYLFWMVCIYAFCSIVECMVCYIDHIQWAFILPFFLKLKLNFNLNFKYYLLILSCLNLIETVIEAVMQTLNIPHKFKVCSICGRAESTNWARHWRQYHTKSKARKQLLEGNIPSKPWCSNWKKKIIKWEPNDEVEETQNSNFSGCKNGSSAKLRGLWYLHVCQLFPRVWGNSKGFCFRLKLRF